MIFNQLGFFLLKLVPKLFPRRQFKFNHQADSINKEKLIEPATLPAYKLTPGDGPQHMTFSPDSKYAYLINELSGSVIAFKYSGARLDEFQTIQADTVGARGSADIHTSPDGKFLYASNRLQADGVAIFSINPADGTLTKVCYQPTGGHPRNFVITPNGKYLLVASRDANRVEVYERNPETGLLTDIQKNIEVDKPVCLKFAVN